MSPRSLIDLTELTELIELLELLGDRPFAVLTGAGISTESGIPDYRGPGTRERARNPIQHHEFVGDPAVRRRYWARSTIGWPKIARARPNPAHYALARLERAGMLRGLLTQNVDRLHTSAGSGDVNELHGALARVRCLECGSIESRDHLQERLLAANAGWSAAAIEHAPDGDAEISAERTESFIVPGCLECGGVLKPDVVFFGGSVPRSRVERGLDAVERAAALLVVGSSLAVYSGYRFVRRAAERGVPIAIVNLGQTRGDAHARVRVECRAGVALPALANALLGTTQRANPCR